MKTIEIIVEPNGDTRVTTSGFSGPSCREATLFLEKSLGEVASEKLLPAYHQTTTNVVQQVKQQS